MTTSICLGQNWRLRFKAIVFAVRTAEAIVNFTSPELCQLARKILKDSRHGELDIRYVKEAVHQGAFEFESSFLED